MTKPASLQRIVIIGTGNVGSHLARRCAERGREIIQLYSRDRENVALLAAELNVAFTTQLSDLDLTAEAYLLTVPDAAIAAVAQQLSEVLPASALVLHTSGATPVDPLADHFERAGVFYPLQSFNRNLPVDWRQVPILYFATRAADEAACAELAAVLSDRIARVDDAQRARLHLAAVFTNNFPNALFEIAFQITTDAGLNFDLLLPLLRQTVARLDGQTPPAHWQTGPAVREDRVTIERHLSQLADQPEWAALYRLLSDTVQQQKKS